MDSDKERMLFQQEKQDTIEITEDDVTGIDDYDDAFNYADRLGVDLGGLDDLDEMVERLLLHYKKERKHQINPKKQIESVMMHIQKDDKNKRSKLKKLLGETKDTLRIFQTENDVIVEGQKEGKAIEDLLKTEGATKDLFIDFNSKFDSIKSGECMVVVSGETSAGKSSVLNLLLEEDILPTHTCSCTSVVTKIVYGPVRQAKIIYHDKTRPPLIMDRLDRDNLLQQVMDVIFIKDIDEREHLSDVKEIQLFIPSRMLESGLVFVDTPGIGENDAMDDVIRTFVEANQIMGFIYVIKSDNAGGVQEDRLLSLMKIILERQRKFEDCSLPFDPKCAIFLCNFWDNVKKEEADEVYLNTVKKLGQCWPSLDSSQVLRLSTKKARAEVKIDHDYIKDDYRLCLEGIKDLFQRAVDRRVKSTYKWIENILLRSSHHLKSMVNSIDRSDRDLEEKMKEVFDKLDRLRKKSDGVIEDMKTRIKEASQQICDEFREYLGSSASRVAITQWIEDELPSKEERNSWEHVRDEIDIEISHRIEEELVKWEQTKQTVRGLEEQVVIDIRAQLHLLQDDLEDIEKTMQDDDSKVAPLENTFPNAYRDNRGRRISFAAFKPPNLRLGLSRNAVIPIKVLTRVQNPIRKFMESFKNFKKNVLPKDFMHAKKLKMFQENPCKFAKHRAEKKLHALLDPKKGKTLLYFVEVLMEMPKQYIKSLEEKIPALIQSNEDLINHIAICRVDAVDSRSVYELMMVDMERLKSHLMEYGHGHIFVDDFRGEEITTNELGDSGRKFKVSDIVSNSSSHKDLSKNGLQCGLWTAVQNGFVAKDGSERNVSIKIYLPSAGLEHTFPEVAKLRCLRHESIAQFLGIYHSDSHIPAFVCEKHVKSLRQFIKSEFGCLKEDLPRIVNEIAHGVEYLHRKGMVHMELNIDTLTVAYEGIVKLTGGCLPRHAAFPIDRETIEVGEFVYLAPEVLNAELYIACADIYALALLLFELFVESPFSNHRKWRLDHFSFRVNPVEMLDLEVSLMIFTKPMKNLIMQCLDINPDNRPSTDMFLQNMKEIKNETSEFRQVSVRRKSRTKVEFSESSRS